jgi:hypothetical protein
MPRPSVTAILIQMQLGAVFYDDDVFAVWDEPA